MSRQIRNKKESHAVQLELRNASFRYQDQWVLKNINLSLMAGERLVILGPNGCGKTTLAKMLSGYLWPTKGDSPKVAGVNFGDCDMRALRRQIGFVSPYLVDRIPGETTVADVVISGRDNGLGDVWDDVSLAERTRMKTLLRRFGLKAGSDMRFGALSSGQKIRVLLARAEFARHSVLILDEPTAHLDLASREAILKMLRHKAKKDSSNRILITQNLTDVPGDFEKLLLLKNGKCLYFGSLQIGMTRSNLAKTFGMPKLRLHFIDGRYFATSK